MDAILPMISRDLERFELAYRSIARFVVGLDRIVIASPPDQIAAIRSRLPSGGPAVELISELALVPELAVFRRLDGWYRQQLVKLAAAAQVRSAFYLTLDADVVATRPVDLEALCADGRAPCAVVHEDQHPRWYVGASALIGAPLARRGICHAVTPTFLHRDGVKALTAHLDDRWSAGQYSPGLRGVKQFFGRSYLRLSSARGLTPWRCLLCCSRPWSEYSLYYSFLEWRGLFDTYHREVAEGLYSEKGSVWHPGDLARWEPSALQAEGPPFIVLQSTAGIPIETLRAWVEPLLLG